MIPYFYCRIRQQGVAGATKTYMSEEQIEDILTRLRADDRAALKVLFEEYYLYVCSNIHRFIVDRSLVEDLAQEVFIRFWEKRHQITVTSNLRAYLRRMAINEALGYLRRKKLFTDDEINTELPAQAHENAEAQYLHTELEDHVRQAIDSLPPKCRAVFQLSRFEELTYKEIAERMEISVKTVENQMGKALRVLREKLQGYLSMFL